MFYQDVEHMWFCERDSQSTQYCNITQPDKDILH